MTERASQPCPRCQPTWTNRKPGQPTTADRYGPGIQGELVRGSTRELARRLTGAVEIVLLWHTRTDRLCVSVRDASGGVDFELEVKPAEAMEVFHHPYAYAASRGLEY